MDYNDLIRDIASGLPQLDARIHGTAIEFIDFWRLLGGGLGKCTMVLGACVEKW